MRPGSKILTVLLRLALLGILAAAVASAQRGGGGGGGGGRGAGGEIPRMDAATTPFDRIAASLALSKDQKKDIKASLDETQKEAAPLRDEMTQAQLDIGEAIQAAKSQDEIDKAVNAYGLLDARMTGLEMKAFAKIYLSLDKEQQTKAGMLFMTMHGMFRGKNWNELKAQ